MRPHWARAAYGQSPVHFSRHSTDTNRSNRLQRNKRHRAAASNQNEIHQPLIRGSWVCGEAPGGCSTRKWRLIPPRNLSGMPSPEVGRATARFSEDAFYQGQPRGLRVVGRPAPSRGAARALLPAKWHSLRYRRWRQEAHRRRPGWSLWAVRLWTPLPRASGLPGAARHPEQVPRNWRNRRNRNRCQASGGGCQASGGGRVEACAN